MPCHHRRYDPKAFCAGGDIAQITTGTASDYGPTRRFWRDELRLNAMIAGYDKLSSR
jgi:enoyl-CoA hydratase